MNKPELLVNEFKDIYLRKNFENLKNFFGTQNQLLDFKFFEIKFEEKTLTQTIKHDMKFVPRDIVFLGATNNATVSFGIGNFTNSEMSITANKTTTLRFFAGKYFNAQSSVQPEKTDVLVFGPDSLGVSESTFKAPTFKRILSGTGVYETPANVKYLKIEMVGGGAGGSGAGTSSQNNGGSGGQTTFGNNLLIAGGGAGQTSGGSVTVNSPAVTINSYVGTSGGFFNYGGAGWLYASGGTGGQSPFGGAGENAGFSLGIAATANTGSGGSGGGSNNLANVYGGLGGASGGYIYAMIANPSATYNYSIGAGGSGGAGFGANQFAGGAGGSGIIIIEECYQ